MSCCVTSLYTSAGHFPLRHIPLTVPLPDNFPQHLGHFPRLLKRKFEKTGTNPGTPDSDEAENFLKTDTNLCS